jgi:hypothetical protein
MKKSGVLLCFLVLFLGLPGISSASAITIFDKTTFLNATGAVSNGAIPDDGLVLSGAGSVTLNNLVFSISGNPTSQIYFGTGGATYTSVNDGSSFSDWTTLLDGADIALSGPENIDVTVINLLTPVYSLGFEFVEPTTGSVNVVPGDVIDSTFNVKLIDSGSATEISSFDFNAIDDTAYFVGAWTDTMFDTVEITEIVGSHDNEFFGEFYLGSTPVPEPATMLLLGSGLIGLVGFRRKFRKS